MFPTDFKEKLLNHLDARTRSGGLLFSLYIDMFAEETLDIDLREGMNEDIISTISEKGYTYIPEKTDAKHLSFLDCSTIEVTYNDEVVMIGCKYSNGKVESFIVREKIRN